MADALDNWEHWLRRLEERGTAEPDDAEQPVEDARGEADRAVAELRRNGEEPSRL